MIRCPYCDRWTIETPKLLEHPELTADAYRTIADHIDRRHGPGAPDGD